MVISFFISTSTCKFIIVEQYSIEMLSHERRREEDFQATGTS